MLYGKFLPDSGADAFPTRSTAPAMSFPVAFLVTLCIICTAALSVQQISPFGALSPLIPGRLREAFLCDGGCCRAFRRLPRRPLPVDASRTGKTPLTG